MRANIVLTEDQSVEVSKQSLTGIICGLDRRYRDIMAQNPPASAEHRQAHSAMLALQKVGYGVSGCETAKQLEHLLAQLMLGRFKPEDLDQARNTLIHHEGVFVVVIGDDTLEFVKRVKHTAYQEIDARVQGIVSNTKKGFLLRKQGGWEKRDQLVRLRDQISSIHYPYQLVAVKRDLMTRFEQPEQFARDLDASQTVDQMVRCMVNRVQFGTPVAVNR